MRLRLLQARSIHRLLDSAIAWLLNLLIFLSGAPWHLRLRRRRRHYSSRVAAAGHQRVDEGVDLRLLPRHRVVLRRLILYPVFVSLAGVIAFVHAEAGLLVAALLVHRERRGVDDLRGDASESAAPQVGLEISTDRVLAARRRAIDSLTFTGGARPAPLGRPRSLR